MTGFNPYPGSYNPLPGIGGMPMAPPQLPYAQPWWMPVPMAPPAMDSIDLSHQQMHKAKKLPWYASFGKEVGKAALTVGASMAGFALGGVPGAMMAGAGSAAALSALDQHYIQGKVFWGSVAIDGALGMLPGFVGKHVAVKGGQLLSKMTGKSMDVMKTSALKQAAIIGATDGAVLGYVGSSATCAYDTYQKTGKIEWEHALVEGAKGSVSGMVGGALAGGAFTALGGKLSKTKTTSSDSPKPESLSKPEPSKSELSKPELLKPERPVVQDKKTEVLIDSKSKSDSLAELSQPIEPFKPVEPFKPAKLSKPAEPSKTTVEEVLSAPLKPPVLPVKTKPETLQTPRKSSEMLKNDEIASVKSKSELSDQSILVDKPVSTPQGLLKRKNASKKKPEQLSKVEKSIGETVQDSPLQSSPIPPIKLKPALKLAEKSSEPNKKVHFSKPPVLSSDANAKAPSVSSSLTPPPVIAQGTALEFLGDDLGKIHFRQIGNNTCYLQAPLDAILNHPNGREIFSKIKIKALSNGKGYEVKFPGQSQAIPVSLASLGDKTGIATNEAGRGLQIIERAYLNIPEVSQALAKNPDGYDTPMRALERVFGWKANSSESISLHREPGSNQFIGGVEFPFTERTMQFKDYLRQLSDKTISRSDVDIMAAIPVNNPNHYYSVRLNQSTPEHVAVANSLKGTQSFQSIPVDEFLEKYHIEGIRIPIGNS